MSEQLSGPKIEYTYSGGYDDSYLGRCDICLGSEHTCFDRHWKRILKEAHTHRPGGTVGQCYTMRHGSWDLEYVSTGLGPCLVLRRPAGTLVDNAAFYVLRDCLCGKAPLPDGWLAVHFDGDAIELLEPGMVRESRDSQVGRVLSNDVTLAQLLGRD